MNDFGGTPLLRHLRDRELLDFVATTSEPLLIFGVPGTGVSRVLAHANHLVSHVAQLPAERPVGWQLLLMGWLGWRDHPAQAQALTGVEAAAQELAELLIGEAVLVPAGPAGCWS